MDILNSSTVAKNSNNSHVFDFSIGIFGTNVRDLNKRGDLIIHQPVMRQFLFVIRLNHHSNLKCTIIYSIDYLLA